MFSSVDAATASLSSNTKMTIPKLRAGTLDSLMALSDDVAKHDQQVEGVVRKFQRQLGDLDVTDLMVQVEKRSETPTQYINNFKWASNKYQEKLSLTEINAKIHSEVMTTDELLRTKQQEYNQVKSALQSIERKQSGNLAVRSLGSIKEVQTAELINTDNLVTVLVVVPKNEISDWFKIYATDILEKENHLGFYPVLLNSSKEIYRDNDSCLVTVTIFRRKLSDFKLALRESHSRWTVREAIIAEDESTQEQQNLITAKQHEEKTRKALITWSRAMYGEVFRAFVHLKVIRVFVESVLRYGVPYDCDIVLMKPKSDKSHSKIKQLLFKQFDNGTQNSLYQNDNDNLPPGVLNNSDFYPYVFVQLTL